MLASGNPLLDHERIYRAMEEFKPQLGSDILRLATRANVSQVVLDRTWDQLGRERQGDLMHQLLEGDPNSAISLTRLSALAMGLGRLPDAVEIGAKTMESREAMSLLLLYPTVSRRMRKSFELVVLEPTQAEDAVFLEGWSIDSAGAPLDPPMIWADGRWLTVTSVRRDHRLDVKEAYQLGTDRDLGFRLIAMSQAPILSPPNEERPFRRSMTGGLAKLSGRTQPAQKLLFKIGDFECGLPAAPGCRGHIDRGGWQRAAKIALPSEYAQTPIIEVETSVAAQPAIVWSDGAVDWGKKMTGNRVRFVREDATDLREITVIAPSGVRTHVIVN